MPKPPRHRRLSATVLRLLAPWALAGLLAACGGGGGGSPAAVNAVEPVTALGADQLAVLFAEGDATSEAIARAYQVARGIPEANMVRVAVPTGSDVIGADAFNTLKSALDARLPAGVQATLVTWTRPSRVAGSCTMGLTSALAFGYSAAYCGTCAATRASPYFNSSSGAPWTDLRMRPSMMLGARTLAEAQALIARGVAADRSVGAGGTTGQGWLLRTSDAARSVRSDDFRAAAALAVPGITMNYVDNAAGSGSDLVVDQSRVMFYFTGLVTVPGISSNTYLPGAVADHLTSYGGLLPDGLGQMPATAWLQAGVTGSYGTVEEPCNFTEKFPRAALMVGQYARGATLIEAYWKSVQWPGQGLFVGEPLAKPWAR